jgi:hypothetical protein
MKSAPPPGNAHARTHTRSRALDLHATQGYESTVPRLVKILERMRTRDVTPDYTYYGIASPLLQVGQAVAGRQAVGWSDGQTDRWTDGHRPLAAKSFAATGFETKGVVTVVLQPYVLEPVCLPTSGKPAAAHSPWCFSNLSVCLWQASLLHILHGAPRICLSVYSRQACDGRAGPRGLTTSWLVLSVSVCLPLPGPPAARAAVLPGI